MAAGRPRRWAQPTAATSKGGKMRTLLLNEGLVKALWVP